MIKLKNSEYLPGRKKGYWYKWKKNPKLVDAILMYAQRGHGKRSSYYSDFTFGVWKENELVPIGKAYSGYIFWSEFTCIDYFKFTVRLNRYLIVKINECYTSANIMITIIPFIYNL